ncbi:hypothetical protein L249_4621 [Ophiocordyceps polyrhachis-furcata BCC 54312]|uniref:RNA recognition motif-containing protein n=1 Tax=Ophiocordyceps polyrhachis-furcata BCC 54312 TaxID=1330021 RepID=A0A367LC23_9HYPO|nr:hypothetical protein L249_4621 [Ophiocordyceps polyrhachis-furcata BCC 54312]
MASRPGEENVAILFGDVHYFYAPRDQKPQHHRFDCNSYVYLFEDVGNARCRVEIANNPGTENQDAFTGYLDRTHVRYSYKHHCLVSLMVADSVDPSEWHLPSFDVKNENQYHYKLHSLDIYFWTQQDALRFVDGLRRVLPSSQLEVLHEPAPPPQLTSMSSVVQNLERAASSGAQCGLSGSATTSQRDRFQNTPAEDSPHTSAAAMPTSGPQGGYQPMAYNPAAPAAPETIRHRDKTPPPDDDPRNPLAVAVAHDLQGLPHTPGLRPQPGGGNIASSGMPDPGIQRAETVTSPSGPSGVGQDNVAGSFQGSAPASTAPAPQQPMPQSTPLGTGCGVSPPPPGGYPFGHQTPSWQQTSHDYSIHAQLYQPTASEMHYIQQPKKESKGKLEEHAGRLERGVSGMLKKFEKKFG